jgi:hypothetical protein
MGPIEQSKIDFYTRLTLFKQIMIFFIFLVCISKYTQKSSVHQQI